MLVHVTVERAAGRRVGAVEIERRARAMLRALGLARAELSIVLTGDLQIRKLNRTFRKTDKKTDVLSFAMREGAGGDVAGELLGDVVISVPTAARQAKARAGRVLDEVTLLLAHGLLHLLGWDHDTVARDRAMTAEVGRLCAAATRPRARR